MCLYLLLEYRLIRLMRKHTPIGVVCHPKRRILRDLPPVTGRRHPPSRKRRATAGAK